MLLRDRIRAGRGELLLTVLWLLKLLSGLAGLRRQYHGLLVALLRTTPLFERGFYLEVHHDVAESGILPLRHYVGWGDREGRHPMPFFDPVHYRLQTTDKTVQINSLLHYLHIGRYRRISPSPWFDLEYYLSHNKDVARANIDPLLHFSRWGGQEGRSPSPQFDAAYYLKANPEVARAGMNPLLHYLLQGRFKGLATLPEHESSDLDNAVPDVLPLLDVDSDIWQTLVPRAAVPDAEVDLVVPVYGGRAETLRCLYSVLAAAPSTPFELIVINDASPDVELTADLQQLASQGLFTLLHNVRNTGFVQTVNRGMQLHPNRDIVLLNSDTEVYHNWLDRLRAAAYSHPRTATVTPLSNNATICSYPRFLHDNPYPLELSYADLDNLAAQVNKGVVLEAPTGVGFCMYIRRDCLHQIGLFDDKTFGKGYGEENDFCQRALHKGWQNSIATDVFVRHWGAASFRGEKAKRVQQALTLINQRYPDYDQQVAAFIQQDPLAGARRRLDWARLLRLRADKNVLLVCHNRGGGVERHIQEDIQLLTDAGSAVYLLRPLPRKPTHVVLRHHSFKSFPNLPPYLLANTEELVSDLQQLGIREIHTHSLVDLVPEAPDHLVALAQRLGARLEVNLHDYKAICPRINLVDENGLYCGEPDEQGCNLCLKERGNDFGVTDIRTWRATRHRKLQAADTVLVPDQDMTDRLLRYFPDIMFQVSPHEELTIAPLQPLPKLQPGEKLRVVVIGAIGKNKGFNVLLGCARDAPKRNLPLQYIVMGYSMNDRLLREAGVQVTGKYHEHEALALLHSLKPHLVFLPSLWPETYSYTLSLALQGGYPVVAFDIGAIAARLNSFDRASYLLPLSMQARFDSLNDFFCQISHLE